MIKLRYVLPLALCVRSLAWADYAKNISFKSELLNPAHEAQEAAMAVQVSEIQGVKIVDPDKEKEQPKTGEAHIHYQLDNGPIVATTVQKLTFHGLTPGKHTITITLAANNHAALTDPQKLDFDIPANASG
jgi:hypothetical protein